MVLSVASSGHASQNLEEVDAVRRRLAELSVMLSKGELAVIPDTQINRKGIAEHLFSVNDDVWLMLGCQATSAQSRQKKAISHLDELRVNLALADHSTTLSTSCCKDAMIMSLLWALFAIA